MKTNKLFSIVSLMLFAVLAASAVSAVPTIDRVEVDDTQLNENQVNYLSVETGSQVTVDIWLTSNEDNDNIRVEAFITGSDDNDDVSAKTSLFSVEDNATYKKSLTLTLPQTADEDRYSLRVIVSDRNGDEIVQNYNLVLDEPRHDLAIEDVIFYPNGNVQAGQAFLSTVRLENFGQKDENDVKVMVSIPELGISATDYINEIESDDEESTEEMYMRIPSTAKTGTYQVKIDVWYNDGHDTLSKSMSVDVDALPPAPAPVVQVPVTPVTPVVAEKSMLRSVLEGVLLVLVGLLVIVAIILGVSKLSSNE
ncbi:hypothetical protein HY492_02785 [Candidatus Woesearchaeota archaeon]|nr:hypothetical protein [Candidatus Woesearchaeota archaeon]